MTFDKVAYRRARIARARAERLCFRCLKPALVRDGKTLTRCAVCLPKINEAERRRARKRAAERGGYTPLDVILECASVRLLRAMQRFDGVSGPDLLDVLDVTGRTRETCATKLSLAVRIGHASRVDGLYRITPAGRSWLEGQLRRADNGVATDEEAMPHDAAEGA